MSPWYSHDIWVWKSDILFSDTPTCFQFIWFLCAWHILYIFICAWHYAYHIFICIFINIHTYIRTYVHYVTHLHLPVRLHLHYITLHVTCIHILFIRLIIYMLLCCLEKSPREVLPESSWQNPVRRLVGAILMRSRRGFFTWPWENIGKRRKTPINSGIYIYIWLVAWNMNFIFHILGMSSSHLTFKFFRGVETTNQLLICYRWVINGYKW